MGKTALPPARPFARLLLLPPAEKTNWVLVSRALLFEKVLIGSFQPVLNSLIWLLHVSTDVANRLFQF
jgi:hypothetical protein